MVGEIRDRATAEAALQASLTGHLLLSTFHAGSAAETVGRLLDMGIEPYVLRSGILAILHQRLLRRLCACAEPSDKPEARLGLDVQRAKVPRGCAECGGTGYRGRFLLVEMLMLSRTELARAVLARSDTATIERLAVEGGMVARWQRACRAVDDGRTSPAEVRRVLGFRRQRRIRRCTPHAPREGNREGNRGARLPHAEREEYICPKKKPFAASQNNRRSDRIVACGKGDRLLLCEASEGPFRQKVPVPFSRSGRFGCGSGVRGCFFREAGDLYVKPPATRLLHVRSKE